MINEMIHTLIAISQKGIAIFLSETDIFVL